MSTDPFLSVVVPVTGRAELLRETLASLTAQTFGDWELVLTEDTADDAARAATARVIADARNALRVPVRYCFTAPRLGQSANTNQGLAAARGEFVRILHSDDLLAPWALGQEAALLREHGDRVDVLYSDPIVFSDTFTPVPTPWVAVEDPGVAIVDKLATGTALPSSLVFRRAFLDAGARLDPTYRFLCDWKFFLDLLRGLRRGGRALIHAAPGALGWRRHEDSVTFRLWADHWREHQRLMAEIAADGMLERELDLGPEEAAAWLAKGAVYRRTRGLADLQAIRAVSPTAQVAAAETLFDALVVSDAATPPLVGMHRLANYWEVSAELLRDAGRGEAERGCLDLARGLASEDPGAIARADARLADAVTEVETRVPPPTPPVLVEVPVEPSAGPATPTAVDAGFAAHEAGRHDEALRHFHDAIAGDPTLAEAWEGIGHAAFALRRFDESIAAYRRFVGLAPDRAPGWQHLGDAALQLGLVGEAAAAHARGAELAGTDAGLWRKAATTRRLGGDLPGAARAMDQARALDPDDAAIRREAAILAWELAPDGPPPPPLVREAPIYCELLDRSRRRGAPVGYQLLAEGEGIAMKMAGHYHPWSLKHVEFEFIGHAIRTLGLRRGYELGTAFGISTLAIGLAMRDTGGRVVTMDAYIEELANSAEAYRWGPEDRSFLEVPDAGLPDGMRSLRWLVQEARLGDVVIPRVGRSPEDVAATLAAEFDPAREPLDFVYIDAAHWDEALMQDLDAVRPLLGDRWLILLHDSHCFGEAARDHVRRTFGRDWTVAPGCESPRGWNLAVLTNIPGFPA